MRWVSSMLFISSVFCLSVAAVINSLSSCSSELGRLAIRYDTGLQGSSFKTKYGFIS